MVIGRGPAASLATRAVGTTSRMCWKDHRLYGACCQLESDQRSATAGGKPIMVMKGLLQLAGTA